MEKDNNKYVNYCVICDKEIKGSEGFVFFFNEDSFWFCDSHAQPFKMGISLGQLEINAKFLSFISGLDDANVKEELKKYLRQLSPMSKLQSASEYSQGDSLDIRIEHTTPKQLYDELGKTVVGQEEARKAISISVINHMQFLNDDIETITHSDKHHVLMLGRSGSGKTLIASTVAKLFNLPFVMGDATNYSPTGFQGSDADSVIQDLLIQTDMNFELAERGVVFMDEIDKICCSNKASGRYESFIGSTQSTLLKLIEGKMVKVPGMAFGEAPGSSFNVDSSRILFFFGGAFNGLSDIVAKRMGLTERSLGFRSDSNSKNKELDEAMKSYEIFSRASREDLVESLIEFGMLSEFVGRIPTIVALKPLSKEELMKVLVESSVSPIDKQKNIFARSGYTLNFTDEFLTKIVELSYNSSIGTRALDAYVKKAVSAASFDLLAIGSPSAMKGIITITEDCIDRPQDYQKAKIMIATSMGTSVATL